MAKLTRQMLDFYRGSVVEYEKGPVDLNQLLQHLIVENNETFESNKIQTLMNIPPSAAFVLGSQDKLKQVFLNLILNARDAMPNGGTISIAAHQREGRVNIQVSDTGMGIPAENLGRIFDAFFTTKKEVSGVGLGLSVTYGIVQQHNGSIHVTSTVNKGTTFTIELPATRNHHG
jgi:signal transduction histidine kinase